MRQLYTAIAVLATSLAHAQCPFTPTITPEAPIVCPVGFLLLETQTYDSYQWYEDGMAITGQTFQTLQVDAASVMHEFTVECTLDGCTEMSEPVLLDGWVFLLPFVMTAGDEPTQIGGSGEAYYCPGDTVLLVLMPPYDTSIQWTDNGSPIPGATDDTLIVTTSGNFHVSGAPGICPGFMQQLGVTITIEFMDITVPEIMVGDASICISPENPTSYQWYLNGEPIDEEPCFVPSSPGAYTVTAGYAGQCGPGTSEPYIIMGVGEHDLRNAVSLWPNPANDRCTVSGQQTLIGPWRLLDAAGREARTGRFTGGAREEIDLNGLEAGNYALVTEYGSLRVAVLR